MMLRNVGLCLVLLGLLSNEKLYAQEIPKTIVYGTVYNIFQDQYKTDEEFSKIVNEDMQGIKDANFNIVMPFPFGQWDRNSKQQDWTRTDILVDAIENQKLMLMPMMLKSTHRAYLPTWKWLEIPDAIREYPEISRTTEDVKYQHPLIKNEIENYFQSVANRYGDRNSLVGYNIWNEAHYYSVDEITIPKFRNWLRNKYGDLEELNRVWAEDYTDWDQITPLMSRNWESSMAAIDWELFRYKNVGELSAWVYQTMRKYDKKHFNAINTVGTLVNNRDYTQWTVDGREISPNTDIFGISFYPDKYMNEHKKPMPYWKYSSMFNVTRNDAGNRPYYLVEAQTNQQNGLGVFQFMSYNDIYLLSWMAIAENAKGIIFWKWKPFYRGQQAFGRGLTMANGELAPRGKAAQDVGDVLKNHGETLFSARLIPAEAAILYDVVTLQKSLEDLHNPAGQNTTNYIINESFEGTYKALFDNNVSADIIRTDKSLGLKDLSKYKILYLPTQMVIRKNVAELLKEYVSNGGWVVADARTAIMDEYDFGFERNPGYGLDKVFGAYRLDLLGGDTYFDVTPDNDMAATLNMPSSPTIKGIYFKEKIQPLEGSKVLATFPDDGEPAILTKETGKGRTVISAVPLGLSYYKDSKEAGNYLAALALKAGVQPNGISENSTEGLVVRIHNTPEKNHIVYVINSSDQDYAGTVVIPEITDYEKVTELISNEKVRLSEKDDSLRITLQLSSCRAKVFYVR